jgi:hypothetical protein
MFVEFAGEWSEGGREKNGVAFIGIGGVSMVAATPLEFEMDPEAYFEFRNDGLGYPLAVCVAFEERLSSYPGSGEAYICLCG